MRLIDAPFLETPLLALHRLRRWNLGQLRHLLRGMVIDRPNQVWCTDITDMPMRCGFLHLAAVMDWSAKVLSWRVSNTMDVAFCIEALARFDRPEIFNTDQASQFTSSAFTNVLKAANVRISTGAGAGWTTSLSNGSGAA